MSKHMKAIKLLIEDATTNQKDALYKWMGEELKKRSHVVALAAPSDHEMWWRDKLVSGELLPGEGWASEFPVDWMTDDYIAKTNRYNVTRRGNATAMGRLLKKLCPGIRALPRGKERQRCYSMPSLERCRAHWDLKFGKTNWGDDAQGEN